VVEGPVKKIEVSRDERADSRRQMGTAVVIPEIEWSGGVGARSRLNKHFREKINSRIHKDTQGYIRGKKAANSR
jgi:hypothetical protein